MKRKSFNLVVLLIFMAFLVQACQLNIPTSAPTAPPVQPGTNTPAATQPEFPAPLPQASEGVRFIIQGLDNTLSLVDSNGQSQPYMPVDRPFDSPVFQYYPSSRTVGNVLYALAVGNEGQTRVYTIDANGIRALGYIENVHQGFAVWPGGGDQTPRLAWDELSFDPDSSVPTTRLFAGNADGSDVRVLIEETNSERVLVVGRWSRDGQRLFFSKEPLGLGGYILFGGASNLWVYHLADGRADPVVGEPGMACIDDLSYDETLLVHHCANPTLSIVQIASGAVSTINPPAEGVEANFVGSARFTLDGQRVAFGIARGDPENEQGWVAVSDGLAGDSRLIATAPAGEYFQVVGWLDSDTLVLQTWGITPGVWLVNTDGSSLLRIADGVYQGLAK